MFSSDEIDILFEALTLWENKPDQDAFSDALGDMFISRNGAKERREALFARATKAKTQRQRRTALLKAKLVQAQDETTVTELFAMKSRPQTT